MNSKKWQVGAVVVALMSVGAYAYVQHRAATDLTARVAEESADATKAHEAAATLAAQLAATAKAAEQARSEATANEAQATAEQQQLDATKAKLAAEARPDLPVNLSFRRAVLHPGLVGVFRNTSSRELEFLLDVDSPATGDHFRRSIVLNPRSFVEIGARQGWPFAPGQRVTLNNPVYRPLLQTVGG
jgi:hypothetical protein